MIELRPAQSDEDLELWRQVRLTVLPDELCAPVDELRRSAEPGKLFLLAHLDGRLAGSGLTGRSDLGGAFVAPRVLPTMRRRGVGGALLRGLAEHASALGLERAVAHCDDPESLAFARRFGFDEVGRQVEQVLEIRGDEAMPVPPRGIELVSLQGRDDLFERTYGELAVQVFPDVPTPSVIEVSAEDWERRWLPWREASFVALADGVIVGCAGLIEDHDQPARAEHSLTAVRRDWRRRGVATALKQATIAWAAMHGVRELYTWTQNGNEGMRTVNRSLGYVVRNTSITVARDLPLA